MAATVRASGHKQAAMSFLKLCATGKLDEAYDRYVSPRFRHHNPHFRGDAGSLKTAMAEAHEQFPDTSIEIQHVCEDGDLVAVHSRVTHGAGKPEIAVVHMLRFEGDRIAELWDVAAERPADSPNENGMF